VPVFSELPRIGGTLVWYCLICKRQVWLISHGVEADKEDEFLKLGRLIDESSYERFVTALALGTVNLTFLKKKRVFW